MQRRPLLGTAALGAAGLAGLLGGCGVLLPPRTVQPQVPSWPPEQMPPPAPREFRAAWVASVAHIDWPSRTGLDPLAQKAEMTRLLDQAVATGLNALIVQIRPAADALYPSALEPWSEYLTGQQGRAPQPAWDPLQAWCDGAHLRGLELHAWFNPYRARHPSARSAPDARHVAQRLPQAVRRYGDQLWLDPGEAVAQAHTLAVVEDVLRRYPVDAVHIDDYFYPYPMPQPNAPAGHAADLPFPDDEPWAGYRAGGGTLTRDDWRRDNVDRLVQRLYETVQRHPGVRLGISPFGIGRPDRRPPGISGFSQYDRLFADVERWLEMGWLDYLVPQLYWPRDQRAQAFEPLLDYWLGANRAGRHVWPGLFTSRVGAPERPWRADEIAGQVALARSRASAAGASQGQVHFSMVALQQDRDGLATRLRQEAYAQAALAPATPWRDMPPPPPAPQVRRQVNGTAPQCRLTLPGDAPPLRWAVWRRYDGRWQFSAPAGADAVVALGPNPLGLQPDALVVSAVDRQGQEGPRVGHLVDALLAA